MDEEKRRKEEIRKECWNSFYIHIAIAKAPDIIVFIVFDICYDFKRFDGIDWRLSMVFLFGDVMRLLLAR